MKKVILFVVTSLLLFTAANSQAQECCDETNFYGKIFGGGNFVQNSTIDGNRSTYQEGYIFAASLGYTWHYGLSLEAEYAFRRNDISKIHLVGQGHAKNGHLEASSVMGNLFFEVPIASWGYQLYSIQPYFGAGIGYDFQKMHASNATVIFNQKWNHFSWQVMAGLAFPIFCNTEITLEYKFHQGGSHFNNNSIGVGLAYKFGFLQ